MWQFCVFALIFLSQSIRISSYAVSDAYASEILPQPKTPANVLKFAGKKYYYQTIFKANWYQAHQFCNKHNMRLLSINNQAENDRLGKFAEEIGQGRGHFWTSGTNLHDNGEWIWLSTGNVINYTNWYPGEPNDPNKDKPENCIEVRTVDSKGFTWNNVPCSFSFYFICESLESQDCSGVIAKK